MMMMYTSTIVHTGPSLLISLSSFLAVTKATVVNATARVRNQETRVLFPVICQHNLDRLVSLCFSSHLLNGVTLDSFLKCFHFKSV